MNPSNPKYTLQEVGLTEPKPINKVDSALNALFEALEDCRQHHIFTLLNPEE